MQKRSMFGAGFKVWIDAICINQADTVERSRQVRKMRDLYTVAWSVVIWLGVESGDSHKAINLLENLSRYFLDGDRDERDTPKLSMEIEMLKSSLKNDPEYFGRGSWVALREFLGRPYWDRLWIIQKVVLSASKTVLCGTRSINWDVLCRGLGTIHNVLFVMKNGLLEHDQKVCGNPYSKPWNTKNLHRVTKDLWLLGEELRKDRNAIYLPGKRVGNDPRNYYQSKPLDVHRLLKIFQQSLAFDGRDKFYGLLAIVEPEFARQITPSYDIGPGAVFNMVSKTHIQTYNSLEILREANPWGAHNSASWAPDWNWHGRYRFCMHMIPYKASGTTAPIARFSDGDRILTCSGVIIDKVNGLGPRHRDSTAPWGFKIETMVQPQATSGRGIDFDQVRADLCCTLTRERSWEVPNNESTWHFTILNLPADVDKAMKEFSELGSGWEFLASERDYYQRWSWRKAHAEFKIFGRRLDEFFTDRIPSNGLHNDHSAAYNAAKGSSQAQRLVVTEKDRIGWVPDNNVGGIKDQVQRGDLFCILFGCSTPIVMHPYVDGFIVLGEGYLQGMMEGEALQILGKRGLCPRFQDLLGYTLSTKTLSRWKFYYGRLEYEWKYFVL